MTNQKMLAKQIMAGIRTRTRQRPWYGPTDLDEGTVSDMLNESRACPVCGAEYDSVSVNGHANPNRPELDRFDSRFGYIRSNVHIICHACNSAKSGDGVYEIQRSLEVRQGDRTYDYPEQHRLELIRKWMLKNGADPDVRRGDRMGDYMANSGNVVKELRASLTGHRKIWSPDDMRHPMTRHMLDRFIMVKRILLWCSVYPCNVDVSYVKRIVWVHEEDPYNRDLGWTKYAALSAMHGGWVNPP